MSIQLVSKLSLLRCAHLQGILHSAWEAISSPPHFVKRDSARSFEDYACANFGSSRGKLLKTDSAKSEGLANDFDPSHIVGWQRTWLDFLLCRPPRHKSGSIPVFQKLGEPSARVTTHCFCEHLCAASMHHQALQV